MAGINVRTDVLNQIPKPKLTGKEVVYRALAAALGGPVDLASLVMSPFGYNEKEPVLGSEWIGSKMEQGGLVSEARDPLTEFVASLAVPGPGAGTALAKGSMLAPVMMGVIKKKGGNWLTGSVEESLKPLKASSYTEGDMADLARFQPEVFPQAERRLALDNWISGPLTKYVKTRMASPDDEIRKLADQGVLHFSPDEPGSFNSLLYDRRQSLGEKPMGESTTPLGMSWEGLSDNAVGRYTAGDIATQGSFAADNSWASKLDPMTPVHAPSSDPSNFQKLDFRHLTDELSNALNPESGLPRALQLTPDQMKNLSVEKAVRRVADINKWRASQMAESNKAIAFDEKTAPIFKEYPTIPGYGGGQPNEKGLHWREIKQPQGLPDGWTANPVHGDPNHIAVKNDKGELLGYGNSQEDAVRLAQSKAGLLEKQLKYEGDTMGHCVGGYCDAVLSGESQVYTLRDKAGKPHVTIEVGPGGQHLTDEGYAALPKGSPLRAAHKRYMKDMKANDYEPMDYTDFGSYLKVYEPELVKLLPEALPVIKQIKGSKNSTPKEEYLPFIQDFVRSQKWEDIGDLGNTGLYRLPEDTLATRNELQQALEAMAEGDPDLLKSLTPEWLVQVANQNSATWWPKVKEYLKSIQDQ
jgi:hypothetical protein